MRPTRAAGLSLPIALAATLAHARDDRPKVDFNRDVRPILSEACFDCHGPDAAKRKAGLRLDTKDGIFHDFGDHKATVPGDPDASEIYFRIATDDPESIMPPRKG